MIFKALRSSLATVLSLSVVSVIAESDKDDSAKSAAQTETASASRSTQPIAEQISNLRAEYEATERRFAEATKRGRSEVEKLKAQGVQRPDFEAYLRQLVGLAAMDPKSTEARDALISVIDVPAAMDIGRGVYSEQFSRSIDLLVQYHSDDPEVARTGLGLYRAVTRRRDAFLEGIYANAQNRESKGLARMALAEYLARKARFVAAARKKPELPQQDSDPRRKATERLVGSNDERGYQVHLRLLDPNAVRAEAERLFEEVIADYGDIPYVSRRDRNLEALLRRKPPATLTDGKEKEEMLAIERRLALRRTLGEIAEAQLDEMHNLAVGKPAPEIEGTTLDGAPMKLSDYRGKVAVLVFWFSQCSPCMAQVPEHRVLVERLRGRPFALVGVNCDEKKQDAIDAAKARGMTWPSWYDGPRGEGPIIGRYHIRAYPRLLVLDARGIIRHNNRLEGKDLDNAVDALLAELEGKN